MIPPADRGPSSPHPATVTVVIPTFNRSDLLEAAVNSVLIQSHTVHEIIIVDDGSDSHHRLALVALAQQNPRILVHALPTNQGRSRARNEGLARACGDYVLFLDDDDMLDPGMIESALLCFATTAEIDVVVCRARFIGSHGGPPRLFSPLHVEGTAPTVPRWIDAWLGGKQGEYLDLQTGATRTFLRDCPAINACLIRKDAIVATWFAEDLACGEDWLFWLSLTIKHCRFLFNPNGWVYVRRHARNFHPGLPASADIACKRVLEAVRGLGCEEEFLATARLARTYQLQQKAEWRSLASLLAKSPTFLVKYGFQFLAKRAVLTWLRWADRVGPRVSRLIRPTRSQTDFTA